jgi:hypothetical protein
MATWNAILGRRKTRQLQARNVAQYGGKEIRVYGACLMLP